MELDSLEHEVKILELQAREKDQESRLADLKIKELKRSIRHNQLKPINSPYIKQADSNKRIRYASVNDLPNTKVLKKKLENGRVTYQDVILTEENVKLHE